jgi:hypothetical protein
VTCLSAALAGCWGPAVGQVSGKVTFKGRPVTEGKINFINPETGFAAEAELGSDGGYVIKNIEGGLVVGDYTVMVTPPIIIVDNDPGKTPPSPMEKPVANIPAKVRNQATTPLRATVKKGSNTFDFELSQ